MPIHPEIERLNDEIDRFLTRSGLTATAFGWEAIRDPNLYRALRLGRTPGLATLDRIREFMARADLHRAAAVSAAPSESGRVA
jgi:hypothetical protein